MIISGWSFGVIFCQPKQIWLDLSWHQNLCIEDHFVCMWNVSRELSQVVETWSTHHGPRGEGLSPHEDHLGILFQLIRKCWFQGVKRKAKSRLDPLNGLRFEKYCFFFFPEDDQWSFRFYHEHICSNIKVLQGDQWSWIIFSLVKRNTVIFCKKPYPKAKQTLEVLFVHQMININDQ